MKVLFVCSGNAHRSPLAEALLKKFRPDLEVDSAGLHTAIPISEEVRAYLEKESAQQYLKRIPQSLDSKRPNDYDLIVVMQLRHKDVILARCPKCKSKIAVWNIEDPYLMSHEDAEKVYKQIQDRVRELARTL